MDKKMNLNDISKWLQYNKEWKIKGGLNTFRTHCTYYILLVNYEVLLTLVKEKTNSIETLGTGIMLQLVEGSLTCS